MSDYVCSRRPFVDNRHPSWEVPGGLIRAMSTGAMMQGMNRASTRVLLYSQGFSPTDTKSNIMV